MIYRHNLELLKKIQPGQLVSVDSNRILKLNNGFGAKWITPSQSILDAISISFKHYLDLFKIVNSKHFVKINKMTQETETKYPNLLLSLEGLVTLGETYKNINVNHLYLGQIVKMYLKFMNELKKLQNDFPDFFQDKIKEEITIEDCEETLRSIEFKLETIASQSNHPDKEKAELLMDYINVLKDTIQNCYKTLNEKALILLKSIIDYFQKLTKKNKEHSQSNNSDIISNTNKNSQDTTNIDYDEKMGYINIDRNIFEDN